MLERICGLLLRHPLKTFAAALRFPDHHLEQSDGTASVEAPPLKHMSEADVTELQEAVVVIDSSAKVLRPKVEDFFIGLCQTTALRSPMRSPVNALRVTPFAR
jgi:hypothetical protein